MLWAIWSLLRQLDLGLKALGGQKVIIIIIIKRIKSKSKKSLGAAVSISQTNVSLVTL